MRTEEEKGGGREMESKKKEVKGSYRGERKREQAEGEK